MCCYPKLVWLLSRKSCPLGGELGLAYMRAFKLLQERCRDRGYAAIRTGTHVCACTHRSHQIASKGRMQAAQWQH